MVWQPIWEKWGLGRGKELLPESQEKSSGCLWAEATERVPARGSRAPRRRRTWLHPREWPAGLRFPRAGLHREEPESHAEMSYKSVARLFPSSGERVKIVLEWRDIMPVNL